MKLNQVLITVLVFLTSPFFSACDKNDPYPTEFDYSEKIIGKWKQKKSFDLVDSSVNPSCWDWFDVSDGFTLELAKDSTFVYTKYGTCITGTYSFNPNSSRIYFLFDCEILFWGESINSLTERFVEDKTQNTKIFMSHADAHLTETQAFSILERIYNQ